MYGRYDVDCRPIGAYLLKEKLNNCKLVYTIEGHSQIEPETLNELIKIQEEFKSLY